MSVNKLSADYSRYLLPSQFLLILELENKVKGLSMKYKESDEPPGEPSKAFFRESKGENQAILGGKFMRQNWVGGKILF